EQTKKLLKVSDGQWSLTQVSCHSDLVTDMDFSPFDERLLATCSADETLSRFPQDFSSPDLTLHPGLGRLELLLFHPTSSGVLAVGTTRSPLIWDVSSQDAPLYSSLAPPSVYRHNNTKMHKYCKRSDNLLVLKTTLC
uniref:Uncharacterized protein n=1 Tax=Gouania willdenowi TaxID=441366 RepID=A0A8C5GU22_GOUWI